MLGRSGQATVQLDMAGSGQAHADVDVFGYYESIVDVDPGRPTPMTAVDRLR